MEYSKTLINLIQKARRAGPASMKDRIKLADPNVLLELESLYELSSDEDFKLTVRDIFAHAGVPWPKRLEQTELLKQSVSREQHSENPQKSSSLPNVTSSLIKGDLASILNRVD